MKFNFFTKVFIKSHRIAYQSRKSSNNLSASEHCKLVDIQIRVILIFGFFPARYSYLYFTQLFNSCTKEFLYNLRVYDLRNMVIRHLIESCGMYQLFKNVLHSSGMFEEIFSCSIVFVVRWLALLI